jgi:hypothetical protein
MVADHLERRTKSWMSCVCAGVSTKPSGSSRASEHASSLMHKPPSDRPTPGAGQLFFDPGRALVGAYHSAVDHVGRAIAARQFRRRFQQSVNTPVSTQRR